MKNKAVLNTTTFNQTIRSRFFRILVRLYMNDMMNYATVPENTTVEYDITPEFHMILPTSGAFTGADLTQDLTAELAKVEK